MVKQTRPPQACKSVEASGAHSGNRCTLYDHIRQTHPGRAQCGCGYTSLFWRGRLPCKRVKLTHNPKGKGLSHLRGDFREKCVHKCLWVEGLQVISCLPNSHELYRHSQLIDHTHLEKGGTQDMYGQGQYHDQAGLMSKQHECKDCRSS